MAIRARSLVPQKLGPSGVAVVQVISTVTGMGERPVKVSAVKLATLATRLDTVSSVKIRMIGRRR